MCIWSNCLRSSQAVFLFPCLRYEDDGEDNTGQANWGEGDEDDDKPKLDEHKVQHLDHNKSQKPEPSVAKASNGFVQNKLIRTNRLRQKSTR